MTEAFKVYDKCPLCNGTGVMPASSETPSSPCTMCKGTGQVQSQTVEGAEQEASEIAKLDALQVDVTKCLRRLKKLLDNFNLPE